LRRITQRRRQPFLLLTAGDPANLSRQTRESLLKHVVEKIASGERVPLLDFDTFKRFCRPDLAQAVRKLWDVHHAHPQRETLAVFVAGPATLAFLVGRALSQNVFPNINVFQKPACEIAYSIGYRRERHTILFLTSNPADSRRLELDEELRAVQQELERSAHRARFQLEPKPAPRAGELLSHLRDLKPTVLHFSGHGCHAGLVLPTDDGDSRLLSGKAIVAALEAARCGVKVVILNACYSDSLAEELLAHADCVVAMSDEIGDEDAKSFAVGFYGGLGAGESVQVAFNQGRARLDG